ncbi:MAG TPA: HAD-IA family hydrolase [Arenicellales bacterium]|nr:HAD-IA family hydrolase [Arenicellales bacterium]
MSARRYRMIVFDWDGTLMDSAAKIVNCFRAAARDEDAPLPSPRAVRGIIGLGLGEAIATLFPGSSEQQRQRLAEAYRDHFLERDQTYTGLFPGVPEGLAALVEEDYVLAIATGKARRGLDRVLDETGVREYFAASRCVDEAESKPHPRMLLDLLGHTGIDARDALMVGDTTFDLQMAAAARMDALAVSYGAHEVGPLLAENPRDCLDEFRDVVQWVRAG